MKTNELLRFLKKRGCYKLRDAKGSHEIWYSPITKETFSVPNHGANEVGKGMEKKIKKILLGE
ncbi:type II toxin-antitoxin system HicA family toxin [Capnocytophaga sp. ARDL2]|uniref:type II toxin-antitoxin system HicA family toxin n=1 Tax=Capnocytophaga sp. ARDL2 TaxID=3238809 RepID=UPI00355788D4